MKKSAIAALVIMVVFFGCKKSYTGPEYYMNASVNGASFYTSNCVAMPTLTTLEIYENGTTAGGIYSDISFEITSGYHDTGTYTFPDTVGAFTNVGAAIDSNGNELIGNVGILKLTECSPKVVGTFTFTCVNGTKVTGSFSAEII